MFRPSIIKRIIAPFRHKIGSSKILPQNSNKTLDGGKIVSRNNIIKELTAGTLPLSLLSVDDLIEHFDLIREKKGNLGLETVKIRLANELRTLGCAQSIGKKYIRFLKTIEADQDTYVAGAIKTYIERWEKRYSDNFPDNESLAKRFSPNS